MLIYVSRISILANHLFSHKELRQFRTTESEISLEAAREFIDDERFFTYLLNASHGFKRSLPKKEFLQKHPEVAEFLRKVVACNRSTDALDENIPLEICFRMDGFRRSCPQNCPQKSIKGIVFPVFVAASEIY